MADSSVTKTTKSTAPKSLSIERTGYQLTFKWVCGNANYDDGQWFEIRYAYLENGTSTWSSWFAPDTYWDATQLAKSDSEINKSKRDVTLWAEFPGMAYTGIAFRIKGRRSDKYHKITKPSGNPHEKHYYVINSSGKYVITSDTSVKNNKQYYKCENFTTSDWSTCSLTFWRPWIAGVNVNLDDESQSTFSWDLYIDNDDIHRIFYKWQYRTALIQDCYDPDGSHINWGSYSVSGPEYQGWGSLPIRENNLTGENYSYTRWVAVHALGPANNFGDETNWVYGYHTYATPAIASIRTALLSSDGRNVYVEYYPNSTFTHPVDQSTLQYRVATPASSISETSDSVIMSLSCPADDNWTTVDTFTNSSFISYTFPVTADLTDSAIYVRVKTIHDRESNAKYSAPFLVTGSPGKLRAPTIEHVTPVQGSTKIYTVEISKQTAIEHAFTAIYYRLSSDPSNVMIAGIIPYNRTSVNVRIEYPPGVGVDFGVQAMTGSYSPKAATQTDTPTAYIVSAVNGDYSNMVSSINWEGGQVPVPPMIKAASLNSSTIEVNWISPWSDATFAELSWSNHADAWESTDDPTTYLVKNNYVTRWNIANLSIDEWYVKVRMVKQSGDNTVYGTYSETVGPIQLATAPRTTALLVQPSVVPKNGSVRCSWAYVSTDGSNQAGATIYEAYTVVVAPTGNPYENRYYEYDQNSNSYFRSSDTSVVAGKTYYNEYGPSLATATTNSSIVLEIPEEWNAGETHYVCVGVKSGYNMNSNVSVGVPITIAEEIGDINITSSLVNQTLVIDSRYTEVTNPTGNPHNNDYYEYDSENLDYILSSDSVVDPSKTYYTKEDITSTNLTLTELPLEVSASSVGFDGEVVYYIERLTDFTPYMPDESDREGHAKETIAIATGVSESPVEINKEFLIGTLDDTAQYRLYAIVKDRYGQTKQSDDVAFVVNWAHKAIPMEAEIEVDTDKLVTMITPTQPSGYMEGDVCDIYRLSVDKPELIIKDGIFGTKYVDPYPTLGQFGGHRIVYRTFNGDIITDTRAHAVTDYTAENDDDLQDEFAIVIDFDGYQLRLPYNVSVSNSWAKDFTETKYLGGEVVGDWNPATSKTVSLTTVIPVEVEPDKIELLNRLATYSGACHVRTPDGASFAANVEVKDDREEKWVTRLSKVSLSITRIVSEKFDGMTYAEWLVNQPKIDVDNE